MLDPIALAADPAATVLQQANAVVSTGVVRPGQLACRLSYLAGSKWVSGLASDCSKQNGPRQIDWPPGSDTEAGARAGGNAPGAQVPRAAQCSLQGTGDGSPWRAGLESSLESCWMHCILNAGPSPRPTTRRWRMPAVFGQLLAQLPPEAVT